MPFLSLHWIYLPLALFGICTACHAVLNKRDPRAGFGWAVTCLIFAGFGPLLYWIFGTNRIRTHAQKLHRLGYWSHQTDTGSGNWGFGLPPDHPFHSRNYKGILNVSEKVNRQPLMIGNRIECLQQGEQAYPAMLEAIENAARFIYLSTYIFDADETGRQFAKALGRAQQRGVQVCVLVDAFGERYSFPRISGFLKREGVKAARFLPLSFSLNSLHMNLRNHRKILVVDGKTGFTGGMNIRDGHCAREPRGKRPISDVHFKIEGPLVLELEEIFIEDWYFATRESLPWLSYPQDQLPGESVGRVVSGGPNEDFEKITWILLGALAWAKKGVQIMTPYFTPDRVFIAALNTAALRGVQVEVILPEKSNLPFVDWASRALLWEMLENGVRFYRQPAPFSHAKLFIADESYALIGSSNWDSRSLRLNFELDVEIYDPPAAQNLAAHFNGIRDASRTVTLEEVDRDPLPVKFRNSLFKLFLPYL